MAKYNEENLSTWTNPPSDSEDSKLSNSERMVKEAISEDATLSSKRIEVFGQGSYANDTNVRLNSDIDINVRFTGGFYYHLPPNVTEEDLGLGNDISYSLYEFKNDVQAALNSKFGSKSVVRRDKCITVLGNSYRVNTDVVPTWNYRRYDRNGDFELGAKLRTDAGQQIINYPKQHIDNGRQKNSNTFRRFKRLTRVFKKLRYHMIDDNVKVSDSVTSFLLECLTWNVPNSIFNDNDTWQDRLKSSIAHLYEHTAEEQKCDEWGEVSELLYLFRGNRKWTKQSVNVFLVDAWNYLGY